MTDTTRADMVELINLLREVRPNYGDVGSRDVDVRKRQEQIDRAIGLLARQPAAIDKPIGYVSAGDIAELANGNGAIVSARARDTDVPVYAVPPAQHKSGWHPDFVIALYDNAAPHKRYTMDQMREYADAFHRSRIDAARAASTSANVARLSMDDLQGKALAHGFKYWRAPDAHGITGTIEQAENLIADLVGVEVEITK